MKLRIKIMKWTFVSILFLSIVLSYKPQGLTNPGISKDNIDKVPIHVKTEIIVKKRDSIQNSITKNLNETEVKTDINFKLKEDNIRLSKIENKITNQIIEDLIKEKKDKSEKDKYLCFTEKNFRSIAIKYKGDVYYISKDSVCTEYYRDNIFSKRKCANYDYFLKITK